jgi:acyl-CoA synthetase (AMP-forming)/AMP-acid ligase II
MTGAVWDREFFRRRAAGQERQAQHETEPAAITAVTPAHTTMAGLLLARAEDDNTALLFEDQRWSWRELLGEAATRSVAMVKVRPEGRPWHIGVLLENTPEYVFLIAGAALCGATVVGINPTRRGAGLAADIRGTDCAVVVTDEAYGGLLDGLFGGSDAPRILDAGGAEYAGLLADCRGAAAVATAEGLDPRSALLLLFTSESTGAPKAVICSTGRWAFICQVNPIAFGPGDVAYNAMPIFHGNALMSALGPCIANGAAFALRRRFSASGFRPDIRRFGATARPRAPATSSARRARPRARSASRSRGSRWRSSTPAARPARRPGSTPAARWSTPRRRSASRRCAACCGTATTRSTSFPARATG